MVELDIQGVKVSSVLDTGTEITCIRGSLLSGVTVEEMGKIKLVSAFGDILIAKLGRVAMSLSNKGTNVSIKCAICPTLTSEGLLSVKDYQLLCEDPRLY